MINVAYPYLFSSHGRTATADYESHIRDLIEQVLFTSPGERVNRPTFGSGLLQLVFAPNSVELAGTTQFLVQSSLQEWLGDLIQVTDVEVESIEERLNVTVNYLIRKTQQERVDQFSQQL
jgi:phage baseplate assembly protein W